MVLQGAVGAGGCRPSAPRRCAPGAEGGAGAPAGGCAYDRGRVGGTIPRTRSSRTRSSRSCRPSSAHRRPRPASVSRVPHVQSRPTRASHPARVPPPRGRTPPPPTHSVVRQRRVPEPRAPEKRQALQGASPRTQQRLKDAAGAGVIQAVVPQIEREPAHPPEPAGPAQPADPVVPQLETHRRRPPQPPQRVHVGQQVVMEHQVQTVQRGMVPGDRPPQQARQILRAHEGPGERHTQAAQRRPGPPPQGGQDGRPQAAPCGVPAGPAREQGQRAHPVPAPPRCTGARGREGEAHALAPEVEPPLRTGEGGGSLPEHGTPTASEADGHTR